MVFTIPGIAQRAETVQGGEYLSSDAERARIHGQADHYKSFGRDLLDYLHTLPGTFGAMNFAAEVRNALRAPSDAVFVYTKRENPAGSRGPTP
jgi:hypothetical protein